MNEILKEIRILGLATFVVFCLLLGTIGYVYRTNHHLIGCVDGWANASSNRSSVLTGLSTARSNRLDTLIRDVAGASQQKFHTDLVLYIESSDVYNRALKMHPLPKPPELRC